MNSSYKCLRAEEGEGGQVSTILILFLFCSAASVSSAHLGGDWCYLTTLDRSSWKGGRLYLETSKDKFNKSFNHVVITIPSVLISEL